MLKVLENYTRVNIFSKNIPLPFENNFFPPEVCCLVGAPNLILVFYLLNWGKLRICRVKQIICWRISIKKNEKIFYFYVQFLFFFRSSKIIFYPGGGVI